MPLHHIIMQHRTVRYWQPIVVGSSLILRSDWSTHEDVTHQNCFLLRWICELWIFFILIWAVYCQLNDLHVRNRNKWTTALTRLVLFITCNIFYACMEVVFFNLEESVLSLLHYFRNSLNKGLSQSISNPSQEFIAA